MPMDKRCGSLSDRFQLIIDMPVVDFKDYFPTAALHGQEGTSNSDYKPVTYSSVAVQYWQQTALRGYISSLYAMSSLSGTIFHVQIKTEAGAVTNNNGNAWLLSLEERSIDPLVLPIGLSCTTASCHKSRSKSHVAVLIASRFCLECSTLHQLHSVGSRLWKETLPLPLHTTCRTTDVGKTIESMYITPCEYILVCIAL